MLDVRSSHPFGTVSGVWQFGVAAGQLIVQLPMLVVLLASFIVVSTRRQAIGGRRATLALAGLVVLVADVVLSTIWAFMLPTLVGRGSFQMSQIGVISSVVGFVFAAMLATGVGLLVAALVTPSMPPQQQPYFPPPQ